MSEPRHYPTRTVASDSRTVSVSDLAPPAFALITDLAERSQTSRSFVARSFLEGIDAEQATKMIAARKALKKATPRQRPKMHLVKKASKGQEEARRQDQICVEINGSIPNGTRCLYPNCACR
jgi:hypothetical protein